MNYLKNFCCCCPEYQYTMDSGKCNVKFYILFRYLHIFIASIQQEFSKLSKMQINFRNQITQKCQSAKELKYSGGQYEEK